MNYREEQLCKHYLLIITTMIITAYLLLTTCTILLYINQTTYTQPKVIMKASDIGHKATSLHIKSINIEELDTRLMSSQVIEEPEIKINEEELYLLAKIINAEAGNQPYEGMIAVGNVVMNRVESSKFPDTIRKVIYQKGQFSPVANGAINKKPNEASIQAAKDVLTGSRVVDESVVFFYNPEISTSRWIFTRKVVFRVGDHAFAI